jgi:enamine deaminase RidA (YjgF/YER057c/UK114 family)
MPVRSSWERIDACSAGLKPGNEAMVSDGPMNVEYINPPALGPTHGWTHVVGVTGGRTIHVSGQVGVNDRGEVVGLGDMRVQTEQAFKNIELALAAAGATFQNVVKMNLYVVGLRPEHVPLIRAVRARYVNRENPPASTLVGVSALVGPDWLIEIEVTAVVDNYQ